MALTSPRPFVDAAIAAFPFSCRSMAAEAVRELSAFADDNYRKRSTELRVLGSNVYIPDRFHFSDSGKIRRMMSRASPASRCLLTRSTDGYLRQSALRTILELHDAWVIPFVVLLCGEYVAEIIEDIYCSIPVLDRAAYANFVLENRHTMRIVRSRAMSYWDVYYRASYPERRSFPGLIVVRQFEIWAGEAAEAASA